MRAPVALRRMRCAARPGPGGGLPAVRDASPAAGAALRGLSGLAGAPRVGARRSAPRGGRAGACPRAQVQGGPRGGEALGPPRRRRGAPARVAGRGSRLPGAASLDEAPRARLQPGRGDRADRGARAGAEVRAPAAPACEARDRGGPPIASREGSRGAWRLPCGSGRARARRPARGRRADDGRDDRGVRARAHAARRRFDLGGDRYALSFTPVISSTWSAAQRPVFRKSTPKKKSTEIAVISTSALISKRVSRWR